MIDLNKIMTAKHRADVAVAYNRADDKAFAIQMMESVLDVDPNHTKALCDLGALHHGAGANVSALSFCEQALAVDRNFAPAIAMKAKIAMSSGQYDQAERLFSSALAILPDAGTFNNLAHMYRLIGENKKSDAAYDSAVTLNPNDTQIRFFRSMNHLLKAFTENPSVTREFQFRQLENGPLGEYELRLQHGPMACPIPANGKPIGVAGSRVLICAEQGLGDCIMMLTYMRALKAEGKEVFFICPEHWHGVVRMATGEDGTALFGERLLSPGNTPPDYDSHVPMMSLMHYMPDVLQQIDLASSAVIGSLRAQRLDQHIFSGPRFFPPEKFKIGICWQGSRGHGNDEFRSIPMMEFLNGVCLKDDNDIEIYSLQQPSEEHALPGWVNRCGIEDTGRLAQVINQMDLIVTVDSAPLHIAGALGKQCFAAIPSNPDWRWGATGHDCFWYPTVKLFRSDYPKAWTTPLGLIRLASRDMASKWRLERNEN